ncbi:OmpA family protein [Variovorax sp. OV329]|uniref:OmpA family protein n=1 Tax=Variovorax sp. OV329 TaxID=1882825 RepID=UPI0008F26D30|nr:OmpA family protein [Variovorax sp. OV329]SFM63231.1 Outer membrane protein OmpA [Variovorax sp. OV329]
MFRYLSTLVLALAAALLAPQVKAEKVLIYREGQVVDPQDVADVLGRTRGIRLLDDAPAAIPAKATAPAPVSMAKVAARPPRPAPPPATEPARPSRPAPVAPEDTVADASALSLPVRFAFDSTEILPAARTQLDALAEGIKLLPPGSIVTVEGHTDAVGSDEYNLQLSRGRARAVTDYLVLYHGLDRAHLKTVGYGKGHPLEGANPNAAVNRRVQFHGA